MKINNLLIKNNYLYLSIFLIFTFFCYSSYLYLHIYDGHHHGFIYSNAIDLVNGRIPYKEIFIQYGLLGTFLNSVILKIFGLNILYINIFHLILYSVSILLVFLIITKITSSKYGFFSILILLLNHPVPWLPWPNYLSFFFILLGIFFLLSKVKFNNYSSGVFFSMACLARQDYLFGILIGLFLFFLLIILKKNSFYNVNKIIKSYCFLLLGLFTPITIFLFYLYFNELLVEWVKYINLPKLYFEHQSLNIVSSIYSFTKFFITNAIFNFIVTPQYLLISLILISNTIYLFILFRKKNHFLILISIFTISLSSVAINLELFRLYTSVIIGIIPFSFFIYHLKNVFFKKILLFIIFFISFFSMIFYPYGSNKNFTADMFINVVSPNISVFKYQRWNSQKVKSLNVVYEFLNEIKNNCSIEFVENLTFNSYFSIVHKYDRIKLVPYVTSHKNSVLVTSFDNNFVKKINEQITNQKIILIVSSGNLKFAEGNIEINNKYNMFKINLNTINEKPQNLDIYYPKKCFK
jgi:hypothetical protein